MEIKINIINYKIFTKFKNNFKNMSKSKRNFIYHFLVKVNHIKEKIYRLQQMWIFTRQKKYSNSNENMLFLRKTDEMDNFLRKPPTFTLLRLWNTGLVSNEASLTSLGEGASLALVGHPSSGGNTIKMPYRVDVLHRPASHPIFEYWVG